MHIAALTKFYCALLALLAFGKKFVAFEALNSIARARIERNAAVNFQLSKYRQELERVLAAFETFDFKNTNVGQSDVLANYTRLHTRLFELTHSSLLEETQKSHLMEALTKVSRILYPWLNSTTAELYKTFSSQKADKSRDGNFSKTSTTRGVVFTTGTHLVHYTFLAILALRYTGCRLPVTIAYSGDGDLSSKGRDWLVKKLENPSFASLNFVDMLQKFGGNGSPGHKFANAVGWANKPFAILFAPYRETVFIDSDSFFLQNPEVALLDSDADYAREGALFFRDRSILAVSGPRALAKGMTWMQEKIVPTLSKYAANLRFVLGDTDYETDSGVMLHDKGRSHVFLGLLAACSLNTEIIRNKEVYQVVHGDKETFWMGPEMAGPTTGGYLMHSGRTGSIGFRLLAKQTNTHAATNVTCGGIAHEGSNGRLLWFNGGLQLRKHIYNPPPETELIFEEVSYEPLHRKQVEIGSWRERWWWGLFTSSLSSQGRAWLGGLQKLLSELENDK